MGQPLAHPVGPGIVSGGGEAEIAERVAKLAEVARRFAQGGGWLERIEQAARGGGKGHELGDALRAGRALRVRVEFAFLPDQAREEGHRQIVLNGEGVQHAAKIGTAVQRRRGDRLGQGWRIGLDDGQRRGEDSDCNGHYGDWRRGDATGARRGRLHIRRLAIVQSEQPHCFFVVPSVAKLRLCKGDHDMVDFKKTAAISLSALALAATAPLSASAFAAHPAWRGAAVHSAAYYPHGWHGGWGRSGPFALGALAGAALAAPFSYGGACDPYYGCG